MTLTPPDNRAVTTSFNTFPLNAVVAVDSQFVDSQFAARDYIGTGIIIAPNHVLTAGHNAFKTSIGATVTNLRTNLRTTTSANVPSLNQQRIIGTPGDPTANVTSFYFPKNYNISTNTIAENDISLFRTIDAPITAANTVGLLAFVKPDTAESLTITTAGYPGGGTSMYNGTILLLAPGTGTGTIATTNGSGRFYYSENVDTEGGQSGSGVWHVLDGDTAPRVLGVHTNGYNSSSSIKSNSGTLLTTDVYTTIIDRIQADSGVADAATLPENALVGSDSNFFLSFLILEMTLLPDRIVGKEF